MRPTTTRIVVGFASACLVIRCGSPSSVSTTTATTAPSTPRAATRTMEATTEATPFHAVPEGSVVVWGAGKCEITDGGIDPEGGAGWLVTCELDMSDPRVGGTETQDRFRFLAGAVGRGDVWAAEEARITNAEGTWRGSAQGAEDLSAIPIGEAHYVGEGAYEGLEFHYYFAALDATLPELHGWISPTASTTAGTTGELFTLEGYNERAAAVGWSADGTYLITSIDGLPTIWDAVTGQPLDGQPIDHIGGVSDIMWSPAGTRIDGATDEGAGFFDAVTGERIPVGPLPEGSLRSALTAPAPPSAVPGGQRASSIRSPALTSSSFPGARPGCSMQRGALRAVASPPPGEPVSKSGTQPPVTSCSRSRPRSQ